MRGRKLGLGQWQIFFQRCYHHFFIIYSWIKYCIGILFKIDLLKITAITSWNLHILHFTRDLTRRIVEGFNRQKLSSQATADWFHRRLHGFLFYFLLKPNSFEQNNNCVFKLNHSYKKYILTFFMNPNISKGVRGF